MKNKIFIGSGIIVIIATIFLNLNVSFTHEASINLASLIKSNNANAESVTMCAGYVGNTGVCCKSIGTGCLTGWGEWDGPYYNF